jgi:hypothetical protein
LYFGDENITLRGRVASCRARLSGREWSAVVLLEDASPVIAARWRAVLDARRIGR